MRLAAAILALLAPPATAQQAINDLIGSGVPATTAPDHAGAPEFYDPERSAGALTVTVERPGTGQTCEDVILGGQPAVISELAFAPDAVVEVSLDGLCGLGFRNATEEKAIALRVGEGLRSVAIVSDPRLYSRLPLRPHQLVAVPIRPLNVEAVAIDVRTSWDGQPEVFERFTIELIRGTG